MASSARLDELKKKFEENPRRYFAPLANEHRKSGDLDQAIALCRTHLPQQPGHISGHIVLAQALFEAGSLDESREIFHTALGLDPENLIALRYLGDIAKESRDLVTARSWYERVLEVDPRNDEIEELVRQLDATAPDAAGDPAVAEPPSSVAPPPAVPSAPTPAAPAESDARFAPLSLEEVDIDDSFAASSGEGQPNDAAAAKQPDPYAGQSSWNAAESGADASLLNAPDIDPFDLDPAGGADALLDATDSPSTEDFFLSELPGSEATADGAVPDASYEQNSWAAPEANDAPTAASPAAGEATALDDDTFYLEPPPAEPAPSTEHGAAPNSPAESIASAADTKDQMSIPGMDAFAAEYSTGSYDAIPEPAPNGETIESLANQPTAEWHAPPPPASATSDEGLGLEVMEFIPPSSEAPTHAPGSIPDATDTDPVLGRTPAMATNEESATPAAFVTETMAELYLQQGFRNEAIGVYRELLARNPTDASLRERIEQIESGSISSIGMASVSENVVESALKRQGSRPPRSVRSFFASLAGRRAPAPRQPAPMESGDESFDAVVEEASSHAEASISADPAELEQPLAAPEGVAEPNPSSRPGRITPVASAAETLASFDPFADTAETEPMSMSAMDAAVTPNEPLAEFSNGIATPTPARKTPLSTAAEASDSAAAPESPESPERSLEDLFPDTPVTARADAAAQTFASAFGRSEPQGRPTRAASNELSLDHVFRGAPEGAPATDGGFSFDQFFSDARTSGGDAAAAAPESGRGGGSSDPHDIEQFTAWLEGLKKK